MMVFTKQVDSPVLYASSRLVNSAAAALALLRKFSALAESISASLAATASMTLASSVGSSQKCGSMPP